MKTSINTARLNSMLRGIQKSIDLFPGQGHGEVYFTAQFMRGKQKQNSIERGELSSFATQIRTYAKSEDADTVRIEFIDEATGKSIYSKVLTELQLMETDKCKGPERNIGFSGLGGYSGLGEAEFNALVDKRVEMKERAKDFERQTKELEELKTKYAALESEKEELDAELKAKKNMEFYSGIIGTAFPGLATLFQGTPLAQTASALAGITEGQKAEAANGDVQSVSAMVAEFCNTLTGQEASAFHLLCIAFEKDKTKIQTILQQVMAGTPAA